MELRSNPLSPGSHISAPRAVFHAGMVAALLIAVFSLLLLAPAHGAGAAKPVQIIAFGDSLTAGLGVAPSAAFPAKLQKALEAKGIAAEVANAGVSGDTTSAGLERLDWAVPDNTDIVIVELGANDMLRGLPPSAARASLDSIIARLKAKGTRPVLVGMRSLKNWGQAYADAFEAIYPALAKKHGIPLYPFFLDGVAARPGFNQNDGIHPNAQGVDEIVRRLLPTIERVIAEVRRAKG
ncbi:MAG: arylesterase [Hyphomicrobiaceae bacterium]